MAPFKIIAFDADDTLWHNETLFASTQESFYRLLEPYHDRAWVEKRLYKTETKNLDLFGYGIKAFILSMIETAIELSEGRITGTEIAQLIEHGKTMLRAPVEPLPHVTETLKQLADHYTLLVITKGDLLDQEAKFARSGLDPYFQKLHVVSNKEREVYQTILDHHGVTPQQFLMVGNSLKSDILPVTELGARAVHIPYHITWQHEYVDEKTENRAYNSLAHMGHLPALIEEL